MLLAVVLLFVCTIAIFVFGLLKNSDATKLALERARANPIVLQHIGQPVELGFIISGNIDVNGSSGHADLEIPIHGNKGKGTIYVVADKRAGRWTFSTLDVAFADGSPRIDLLPRPIE